MESVLEAPTATQAETPVDAPTKGKKKKPAGPAPDVKPLVKQLDQMRRIGKSIRDKERELDTQETVISSCESKLKEERTTGHAIEKELADLHEDLANLSLGGFSDRLPFPDKPAAATAAPTNGQAAPSSPDAWKSVPLAHVWREAGANVTLLALLADGKIKAGPRKGQVAEIRTLGDLAAFTSNPHAKLTDISGVGTEKDNAISDAVLKYWQKHPQAKSIDVSNSDKNAPTALDWKPMSDTQHFADTRSGINRDGKSTPQFVVSKAGDKWDVAQSSGCLMPTEYPGSFETTCEAKAWCKRREAELGAKPEYAPLKWEPGEGEFQWVADNTAGILTIEDDEAARLPMQFAVGNEGGNFRIDMSADPLLPMNFPDSFPDLASAQAYCEARNRELCEKSREQMPELYEGKPAKVKKPKASKKATPKRKTTLKK